MPADPVLELRHWADALEAHIARAPLGLVKRVVVFAETGSTQDVARAVAGSEPGLLVLAGRQSAGRGRFGRTWDSGAGLGVAATFAIAVPRERQAAVSLAAGLAAAEASERSLAPGALGLRWPNDVVERSTGRKVAGVLVESGETAKDGTPLLLVGVGINVLQAAEDFPPDLRATAASIAMLGGNVSRLDVVTELARHFDVAVGAAITGDDPARRDLLERWKRRDVLTGRPAAAVYDGRTYEGIVLEIRPDLSLVLRTGAGTVELPGAATTLLHGEGPGRTRAATRSR